MRNEEPDVPLSTFHFSHPHLSLDTSQELGILIAQCVLALGFICRTSSCDGMVQVCSFYAPGGAGELGPARGLAVPSVRWALLDS